MIHLVTGGARAGKSSFVLQEIEQLLPHGPLGFIATAEAFDEEMEARIRAHRAERGPRFQSLEVPLFLGDALIEARQCYEGVVVDCLTVWMGNLLWKMPEALLKQEELLLRALEMGGAPVWLVTNEVGMGIVPENALARRYRDALGRLNQKIAMRAERLTMLVSGVPLRVKG